MSEDRNPLPGWRNFFCLLLLFAFGCDVAASESGVTAWLRASGPEVQFTPGPLPDAGSGPGVTGIVSLQNFVYPGQTAKSLGGSLAAGATAVALALDGDVGYWTIPAGPADVTAPDQPTFAAVLSFAPTLPTGPRRLFVQARDAAGDPGPAFAQSWDVLTAATLVPGGALVVTLRWDRQADLDLHLEQPSGVEIWSGMKIGYSPPPGAPPDPVSCDQAGRLDFDSNAACVIDGRQQEDVVFPGAGAPPSGHYRVRVDTPSLCQQETAHWTVEVRLAGILRAQARGQSTDAATRGAHDAGAGVLALEFDVP